MALKGSTNAEKIFNFLYAEFKNKYGAAAVEGNLNAESALKPSNLEDLCELRLKQAGKKYYTDETYTAALDKKLISLEEFMNPLPGKQYGYGIAQWTSPGRKKAFYNFMLQRGGSFADLEGQLLFLVKELRESYPKTYKAMRTAKTVKEASDIFLVQYECPANAEAQKPVRAGYSEIYYKAYAGGAQNATESAGGQNMGCTLSNSGHDENGNYTGGRAGDQTGTEWELIPWYNRPWNAVLRPKKRAVAVQIAKDATAAANNNNIGYNQSDRDSFGRELAKVAYDPAKITNKCNSDCSKGVIDITKGVGQKLGIQSLKNLGATYTGNMRSEYFKTGEFEILTASKYLTSGVYLLPGDIALNDNHHTATIIIGGGSGTESNQDEGGASGNVQFVGKGIGTATAKTCMNIRSGASTASAILGTVQKGGKVEVLEKLSNGWYKIVWPGSAAGYAYTCNTTGTRYSYKAADTAATKTAMQTTIDIALYKDPKLAGAYKTTVELNLRTGAKADNSKPVIKVLQPGETVYNYGYYNKDASGRIWLYVAAGGKTGYVCTVSETGEKYVNHCKNL